MVDKLAVMTQYLSHLVSIAFDYIIKPNLQPQWLMVKQIKKQTNKQGGLRQTKFV